MCVRDYKRRAPVPLTEDTGTTVTQKNTDESASLLDGKSDSPAKAMRGNKGNQKGLKRNGGDIGKKQRSQSETSESEYIPLTSKNKGDSDIRSLYSN